MELYDLIQKFKHLEYSQKKYHVDSQGEYAQLVFDNANMDDWLTCIGELLGLPIKTEAQPVTDDIVHLTEDFGEIFDHQTLFYHEIGTHRIMAMFWPWKDQPSTTLKIMILTKS